MKKTRGKANPAMSREMLAKKLEELKEAFAQNDVVSTIDNEVISEGDK